MDSAELEASRKRIENRLRMLDVPNPSISYLPYVAYLADEWQSPYNVGCRLMILVGIGYSVHHLEERKELIDWFQREKLWNHVSPDEREFLEIPTPDEKRLMRLSWSLEGALVLGWALGLIDRLPEITRTASDEEMEYFLSRLPAMGEDTKAFLKTVSYRNLGEINEENLVNEMVTWNFRDQMLKGKRDTTQINAAVSYERHYTLNWLRQFSENKDWDNTDTST